MAPIIRNVLLVALIIATAFVTGITKSLVSDGAISIPIMVLAVAFMGALIGIVVVSKPKRGDETSSGTDNKKMPVHAQCEKGGEEDEEWEILSKYDVEVSAAVDLVRAHGKSAVEKLRQAHRVIDDKSQLSRIAAKINEEYRASIAEQFVQEKRRRNEIALTEREKVKREKKELRDLHGIWMLSKNEYICDGKVFKDRHKAITYSQRIERRKRKG